MTITMGTKVTTASGIEGKVIGTLNLAPGVDEHGAKTQHEPQVLVEWTDADSNTAQNWFETSAIRTAAK